MEARRKLPAFGMRDELMQRIDTHQVLIVSGDTGCGKTTQIPQLILEHQIENGCGSLCNIICTQPRRISAVSIANRVSQEYGEDVGRTVGYQIRMEARRSEDTRLLFCTTGACVQCHSSTTEQDAHFSLIAIFTRTVRWRGKSTGCMLQMEMDPVVPNSPCHHRWKSQYFSFCPGCTP
ncbi:unnamed protein product [Ostreobium quekettii]|uniref:Helicase ATP-binding domain-containing protein n=1 Tax=Ostreobium quekettii TaxID=121088 RepID=A0A8S1J3M7_9CHLO|nr:unnamed protein product [Ostreobium quekettii]